LRSPASFFERASFTIKTGNFRIPDLSYRRGVHGLVYLSSHILQAPWILSGGPSGCASLFQARNERFRVEQLSMDPGQTLSPHGYHHPRKSGLLGDDRRGLFRASGVGHHESPGIVLPFLHPILEHPDFSFGASVVARSTLQHVFG
jgi:hypothetical protein